MTDTSDWRTTFRTQHRKLLARLDACRSQHPAEGGEFQSVRTRTTEDPPTSRPWDSSRDNREMSNSEEERRELGREQVRQALRELYSECLERACGPEATSEDQIRTLLSVFRYNIPSRVTADVVGCSRGHARRFEWDSDREEVREKSWSRKQRAHQAPPALADQVRSQDNHECVRCGENAELSVHHIDPVGQQGPAVVENLATLCGQCHKAAHGGNVSSGQVIYDSVAEFWEWTTIDGP